MTLQDFKNIHPNEHAFIIGKGPSLDTVETIRQELSTGIVFCLNESIHKIQSLNLDTPTYVVQQDSNLESGCVPVSGRGVIHFMNSWQHLPEDRRGKNISKKQHVLVSPWNPLAVLYRESEKTLSAIVALKIASSMGIKKVTLCCFDALLNGYQGATTYAECVGKQREGSHRSHNMTIIQEAHIIMESVKTLKPVVAMVHK